MSVQVHEFKRILLKVSGEALAGDQHTGIDPSTVSALCDEIARVVRDGRQIAIVVGAGNFFRGTMGVAAGLDRVVSDQVGMIATLMNAMVLREGLVKTGLDAVVLSAIDVGSFVSVYSPALGRMFLQRGVVTICAAGTGNPFFTTDTAAVLRALELQCDVMFKASKVDGVYDKDPVKHADARRFDRLTYTEALAKRLEVMDLTAFALAQVNGLPLVVFKLISKGAFPELAKGDLTQGTLVTV